MRKKTNIICILWGQKYTETDVNRLYGMIQRNTSHDIDFHLFSENRKKLISLILLDGKKKNSNNSSKNKICSVT